MMARREGATYAFVCKMHVRVCMQFVVQLCVTYRRERRSDVADRERLDTVKEVGVVDRKSIQPLQHLHSTRVLGRYMVY